ncbi:hypothetical protein [Pyrobaculum ferrireducens]|uniref:Uncharacterized protein n=1 Tax=Pyrobaculum ferrireducens TaxID=1104324 RepID=G7VCD1_9CREN|nr:hypothetical protein [Pyrobaculum ferrireducens]AET32551.1 hypothetical protein P186_1118 [Pyrobaculum ferrireducens]
MAVQVQLPWQLKTEMLMLVVPPGSTLPVVVGFDVQLSAPVYDVLVWILMGMVPVF